MSGQEVIQLISAIGAIATPILILVLTVRMQRANDREDYWRELEEKLRDDRIAIYNKILEPFIIVFIKDEVFPKIKEYRGKSKAEVVSEIMLSLEYKQAGFKLALFASDSVLQAYNKLMQHFFKQSSLQSLTDDNHKRTFELLGSFLLEIRRSVGNETTKISGWEMLEWVITDIEKYKS